MFHNDTNYLPNNYYMKWIEQATDWTFCWYLDTYRRRTGTFGGDDLIARKKLHNAWKLELYMYTQIVVKTEMFPILASNETIIIP